jgi:transcriptional regulator with XRE-family HTH domain
MTTERPTDIRLIRQQLRMTQEEFAHAIAVTASTVNRWENAHAVPSRLARRAIDELMSRRGLSPADAAGGACLRVTSLSLPHDTMRLGRRPMAARTALPAGSAVDALLAGR